jgi:hypothetical protein
MQEPSSSSSFIAVSKATKIEITMSLFKLSSSSSWSIVVVLADSLLIIVDVVVIIVLGFIAVWITSTLLAGGILYVLVSLLTTPVALYATVTQSLELYRSNTYVKKIAI